MSVGRSEIKTENLVKISMNKFHSAGLSTDGLKVFLNFNFEDLQYPISFQLDPYVDTIEFAKYYIDKMENLAITKNRISTNSLIIEKIEVNGGQANISEVIKEINNNSK